ncbi:MAG: metalloendopeptidase [Muricauda sp.]|nr:metalloendopeptidase [Allomuricauda sp.]
MVKKVIFLLVCFGTMFSCEKNEDWKDDLIGTAEVFGTDGGIGSCEDAEYGDWKESEYNLPYPVDKGYVVGLSHCSGSYHSAGLPDQFAVDFNMPIGEKIVASRGGSVVYVEESGFDGGFPNNVVVVQHVDGTHAIYAHLTNQGAAVKVGDRVAKGGIIGYSGNTGLAGYPHLHFVVTGNKLAYPYKSLPVNFKNTIANERGPESGGFYVALPN